ncbi:MAG: HAD-IIIC family phosphatase [Candidatus Paceibacterota bacterium]|jgi:FkbH-like protein
MSFRDLQMKIGELISSRTATVADYLKISKEIVPAGEFPFYFRQIKAAFLSSYTIQGLPEVFQVRGVFHNLKISTYTAPYAQISQEILNQASELYKFNPDIVYILAEQKDFLGDGHLAQLVETLKEKTEAEVILVLAGGENRGRERLHIFDFESFLDKIGRAGNWYTKFKDLGDLRLAPQAFPVLAESLLAYAVASAGNNKKCLVVDLDNTLWTGVAGEDGPRKVVPNQKLQEHLLGLYKRGVVLAINSKNNPEDAFEVIDNHPEMILRRDHFAAWRINWNNKDSNLIELSEEMSLGTASFAFIDDDPLNLGLVRSNLPEVAVMHPDSVFDYVGFHSFNLTREDVRRGEMYVEERRRKELKQAVPDQEDFLRKLNMEVSISPVSDSNLGRASQLTQKTNQFNLTTRRYSESEIRKFLETGWKIWSLQVKDVFGDYGIVGLAMFDSAKGHLDNFMLSCRVLGRGVETALLAQVLTEAQKSDLKVVSAEFIRTKKNLPAETFLAQSGFELVGKDATRESYEYDLSKKCIVPNYVRVTVSESEDL